jgi:hypothetical protein
MTQHAFLSPDRKVQRSVFGSGADVLETVVNLGSQNFRHTSRLGGEIVLPPGGFLVESDSFVAVHALNWGGLNYAAPPLFTMRSLDGLPLRRSTQVRVFHAFGDPRLSVGGTTCTVPKEGVLNPNKPATL